MECLGGNGYVEETMLLAALSRGAGERDLGRLGNVMCLDVLRALSREGEAARAVLAGLTAACRDLPGAREAAAFIAKTLAAADGEAHARAAVERLAMLAAAACASPRARPGDVAASFARTRSQAHCGGTFGTADLYARGHDSVRTGAARCITRNCGLLHALSCRAAYGRTAWRDNMTNSELPGSPRGFSPSPPQAPPCSAQWRASRRIGLGSASAGQRPAR
jgi:hypothetical protein